MCVYLRNKKNQCLFNYKFISQVRWDNNVYIYIYIYIYIYSETKNGGEREKLR